LQTAFASFAYFSRKVRGKTTPQSKQKEIWKSLSMQEVNGNIINKKKVLLEYSFPREAWERV